MTEIGTLRTCCLILLLAFLFAGCDSVLGDSHSSDAKLISNFQTHEQEFDQLIQMAKDDPHVVRIANDFTWLDSDYHWPRPDSQIGFSQQRWNEYRDMFSKLGLKGGLAWSWDHLIFLTASAKGMSMHGSEKGYVFSMKPLSPTFESLDNIGQDIRNGKVKPRLPVYRKIKEGWYLYYEGD